MLASVGANLSNDIPAVAYVIDLGISREERARIEASVSRSPLRIEWIQERMSRYAGLPLWGRMTAATYAKLDLPDLLPADAEKAIWLDADLVVTSDLARLWREPIGDELLRAVPDELVTTFASTGGVTAYRSLGLTGSEPYFNAGVMLFNPKAWKFAEVRLHALEYLHAHADEIYFWDQEALNVAAVGRWRVLDSRWNLNASVPVFGRDLSLMGTEREPWVVHYTGQLKPWTHRCRGNSLRQLYYRYLDQTPWAGWRPSHTASTRMVGWYEDLGLRTLMYPVEKIAMRLSRRLSRHLASATSGE